MVHAGYDDKPGSVRAKYCWKGNQMFPQLDRELHFGFLRNGSLVVARNPEEEATLKVGFCTRPNGLITISAPPNVHRKHAAGRVSVTLSLHQHRAPLLAVRLAISAPCYRAAVDAAAAAAPTSTTSMSRARSAPYLRHSSTTTLQSKPVGT